MLTLLFNRRSPVVIALGASSLYFFYLNLRHLALGGLTALFLSLFTALSLFLLFCRFYPFYAKKDRGHGIEEHFHKIAVAGAYVYPLSSLLAISSERPALFFILGFLLLLYPVFTNLAILYYHAKDDQSKRAPGYYSRSLYR